VGARRHHALRGKRGESPRAASRGAREIRLHRAVHDHLVVSVFIPILLMGGLVGRPFPRVRGSPSTIAVTISLLRLPERSPPLMCSRFLRSEAGGRTRAALPVGERGVRRAGPASTIGPCAGSSGTGRFTIVVTLATICLNVYLYTIVPKGLFPSRTWDAS